MKKKKSIRAKNKIKITGKGRPETTTTKINQTF